MYIFSAVLYNIVLFNVSECNCNNHATECKFDPAVFVASGEISGGVCNDCKHNTRGRNCQECKDYFFQDPNKDIRDPEICLRKFVRL